MVRPGLKRLRAAINVKVQPNKTGTSQVQGQSVKFKKDMSKKGVYFNSSGNSPYNILDNSGSFIPTYTEEQRLADQQCRCVKKKVWHKDASGNILPKSWNFSWQ